MPQNYAEALKWCRLADHGFASAQTNLGVMYENGEGVPQNDAEALKWYRLAAESSEAGGTGCCDYDRAAAPLPVGCVC